MNNEIGRKLTSLTLMTIMLAAGFSAFAPSTMPEAAAANANLFVSAENSQFQNYFAGPMVIEVVVIDSSISDTNEGKGEPDVTVNGNQLRMAQASDGNWYAYFADRNHAMVADSTANTADFSAGYGLDFGTFCEEDTTVLGFSVSETAGIAVPSVGFGQGINGTNPSVDLTATNAACDDDTMTGGVNGTDPGDALRVVREAKTLNTIGGTVPIGQIGFTLGVDKLTTDTDGLWPFIQLYDFTISGNVVVQYNKGGGVQSTTLTFDTVEGFIGEQLDRSSYPQGAQVHYTITDIGLNIDPTDEDSWTFQANSTNKTTVYQAFDENGVEDGDGVAVGAVSVGYIDITDTLPALMVENGFELELNVDTQSSGTDVVTLQDNADTVVTFDPADSTAAEDARTASSGINTIPITLTESAPNTAIFSTYDESDTSIIVITDNAPRGRSATITYDDPITILVGFGFATIDIQPTDAEWNSGQEIPVVITDSDANKNSRSDEDLDLFNADVPLIPALTIGDPFTLGEAGVETSTAIETLFISNFTDDDGSANDVSIGGIITFVYETPTAAAAQGNATVQKFSERALLTLNSTISTTTLIVDLETTASEFFKTVKDTRTGDNRLHGYNLLNIDLRGINSTITETDVYLINSTATEGVLADTGNGKLAVDASDAGESTLISLVNATDPQSLTLLNGTADDASILNKMFDISTTDKLGLLFNFTRVENTDTTATPVIVADFFSFGYLNDGLIKSDRINNYIARIEAEETGDNTATFEGSLEFVMLNQLNILDAATYSGLAPIADDPSFIAHQDLDAEEAPRVSYNDKGADGVTTQVSDQQDAPAHSGVVSFDKPTYKIADTVTVTLQDQDLNTDVDLIDIFTVVNSTTDTADGAVGETDLPTLSTGEPLGKLLEITFDDTRWQEKSFTCDEDLDGLSIDGGLEDTGFSLIETGPATGIFTGDFQIPSKVCHTTTSDNTIQNSQGLDMEVNYVDFRDASGQIIEVGDGAGIRANTGSISLDRTVYPVPWGDVEDFADDTTSSTPGDRSLFPLHLTAVLGAPGTTDNEIDAADTLGDGVLTIHVQVNDPDFDTSAAGEDTIGQNITDTNRGPVKVTVSRGVSEVTLAYAGGDTIKNGVIDVGDNDEDSSKIRQLGPIAETTPSSGIFEFDLDVEYTDGPASDTCPPTDSWSSLTDPGTQGAELERFDAETQNDLTDFCILQGDIITVEYTDLADASGDINTVTDSATFDLRNGALQSDKSVYIIGSDMILTLIDPDFDLDNDLAETYNLDLIEWDSDADTTTMGQAGDGAVNFDPEPSSFRETGDSTGIFQVVIEIPSELGGDNLERGEEIVLEYTDWGPSGSDFVGNEDEDVNLTIFTSNFGATVELDQKVYTWTDKVYITVVAPDHNFDSNLVDEIGEVGSSDPLRVATRGNNLPNYKLVETGTDTGIFTGEVILTGFQPHDADGDGETDDARGTTSGTGPTDGLLKTSDDDGLTISYEFSEDETIVGSALIRWNIGEVSWLEASYPASGTGVVRVIDPDMNLNPEAVDNFNVDAWSDSDSGGIDLTVTETNEATGIFEGTVSFTTTDDSSGHRLRVAEGDTVTAEYQDNTLPDPYTTADELDVSATAFIGTVVPPLERAPASNARVVDAFGNTLDEVSVDQQVQITADLTNGQDRDQPFAYLVQIQDEDGVTVSLAWITGSLSAGQSFSPALSWIPNAPGTYTATVFVWESVDNPTALSPPVSVDIDVS